MLIGNIFNLGADIGTMGAAAQLLLPPAAKRNHDLKDQLRLSSSRDSWGLATARSRYLSV
jgi:hypothetical protein